MKRGSPIATAAWSMVCIAFSLVAGDDSGGERNDSAESSDTLPQRGVTSFTELSPSMLDQAKATKQFSLPEGFFTAGVVGDEPAKEVLTIAGVEFPDGTSAKFDREANELVVTLFPIDLMLAEAVVDSWEWVGRQGFAKGRKMREAMAQKLEQTVIPKVDFAEVPLSEVLAFLQNESVTAEDRSGIPIRTETSSDYSPKSEADLTSRDELYSEINDTKITLKAFDASLMGLLSQICRQSGLKYQIGVDQIVVGVFHHGWPQKTIALKVSPDFRKRSLRHIQKLHAERTDAGGPVDPFAIAGEVEKIEAGEIPLMQQMEYVGISFLSGSKVVFDPSRSLLLMKNETHQGEFLSAYVNMLFKGQ